MSTPPVSCSSSIGITELAPLREHVCLPGEPVLMAPPSAVVAIGGGLRLLPPPPSAIAADDAPQVTMDVFLSEYCAPLQRSSHLLHTHIPRYTVPTPACRRYVPRAADPVVAIIARKASQNYYYCYIGGSSLAYMDALAFDGATKVSRPRLIEGDVVYCYVKPRAVPSYVDGALGSVASGACDAAGEVELSCTAAEVGLPPKDWTSGEAVFGPLHSGRVLHLPLTYARRLLTPMGLYSRPGSAQEGVHAGTEGKDDDSEVPASYLLQLLGRRVPFEVAIGLNGLVWVRGLSSEADVTAAVRRTVAVSSCIAEAQCDATRAEMKARVEAYFPC
ncbi:hypothetical protein LSCM1_07403 [Leishmania martiniquensis]|uniref:K Homology domain-containing protein n=1 Tax=Leishmania martiniquensis TaxID=1580590 RepID=A0A836I321_9TRYP|nr:hypothetical protein LSCM1_07403 [Leishmania martiniquensis]